MKGRSGELVRVEIEILSVRGDFTWAVGRGPWAVGRAVVLVQFCVIQLELIEPARCWGDYIIRYSICVAKKIFSCIS